MSLFLLSSAQLNPTPTSVGWAEIALISTFTKQVFDLSTPSMKKGCNGEEWKIMAFIVATNVVASRPPECRLTGTPHARAKMVEIVDKVDIEDIVNKVYIVGVVIPLKSYHIPHTTPPPHHTVLISVA